MKTLMCGATPDAFPAKAGPTIEPWPVPMIAFGLKIRAPASLTERMQSISGTGFSREEARMNTLRFVA